MIAGWYKEDPATKKKLPVEVDIPELLVSEGLKPGAKEKTKAVGDSSSMEQFRMRDATFFRHNSRGRMYQVSRGARHPLNL